MAATSNPWEKASDTSSNKKRKTAPPTPVDDVTQQQTTSNIINTPSTKPKVSIANGQKDEGRDAAHLHGANERLLVLLYGVYKPLFNEQKNLWVAISNELKLSVGLWISNECIRRFSDNNKSKCDAAIERSGVKGMDGAAFSAYRELLESQIRTSCKPVLSAADNTQWTTARSAESNANCIKAMTIYHFETEFAKPNANRSLITACAALFGYAIGSFADSPPTPVNTGLSIASPVAGSSPVVGSTTAAVNRVLNAAVLSSGDANARPLANYFPSASIRNAAQLSAHAPSLRDPKVAATYGATSAAVSARNSTPSPIEIVRSQSSSPFIVPGTPDSQAATQPQENIVIED